MWVSTRISIDVHTVLKTVLVIVKVIQKVLNECQTRQWGHTTIISTVIHFVSRIGTLQRKEKKSGKVRNTGRSQLIPERGLSRTSRISRGRRKRQKYNSTMLLLDKSRKQRRKCWGCTSSLEFLLRAVPSGGLRSLRGWTTQRLCLLEWQRLCLKTPQRS